MEDTKWICSMFTHCFCPLLKVVSTSRSSAESFDKSGPRQLDILVLALYCLIFLHEQVLLYIKRKSIATFPGLYTNDRRLVFYPSIHQRYHILI